MSKLGDLLCKLGAPTRQAYFKLPADDEDLRKFLEAARKLFVGKNDKKAKKFLKMPIDTPDAASEFTKALVAEIDRIKQEAAEPSVKHDKVLYRRLKMVELIEDGLRKARTEAHLRALTVQILEDAGKVESAKRSRGGRKPNRDELKWAALQIEQLRQNNPDIRTTDIADALSKRAKKEKKETQRTSAAWRVFLYRHNLSPRQRQMGSLPARRKKVVTEG